MNSAAVERLTGANPEYAVLWLHGLGADGHDFAPILPQLVRPGWPATRFVFPHAPERAVTINGGMRMRAWYDIKGMRIEDKQDEAGIRESIQLVERWLAHFAAAGIPPDRCALVGFSQGGAIALAAGLRLQPSPACVAALSTYLPLAQSLPSELSATARAMPIWMAHGTHDPVVPITLGQSSAEALRGLGINPTWHSYPMEHAVCSEEVNDLADFFEKTLYAKPTYRTAPTHTEVQGNL